MKSTFPTSRPSVDKWLTLVGISTKIHLQDFDVDTILGYGLFHSFPADPLDAITTIKELYDDNPAMIQKIIGDYNTKLILCL